MHVTPEDRFQLSSLMVGQDADIVKFPLHGIKRWIAATKEKVLMHWPSMSTHTIHGNILMWTTLHE